MEIFPVVETYSLLTIVNFLGALLATLLLILIYSYRRHQFVKPSLMILASYHLIVQWPLVILTPFVEYFLFDPWAIAILVHGFIFCGLLLSSLSWETSAREIWSGLGQRATAGGQSSSVRPIIELTGVACLLGLVYLASVPLIETGLYALLTDPVGAGAARENSLKLLQNPIPKYALSFLSSAVAPLLTALVFVRVTTSGRATLVGKFMWLGLLLVVWALAALSGAKGIIVLLILTGVAALVWQRQLRISLHWFAIALAAILLPAFVVTTVFSSLDEGADSVLTSEGVSLQAMAVVKRAFVLPTVVGIWYVDHTQQNGPLGIGGIPRLAKLAGIEPVSLPNQIGLQYAPDYYGHPVIESVSANAGFLFAFYGYFGMWALPLALLGLVFCDMVLLVVRQLSIPWLVPILAVLSFGALKFTQSDYLTMWVTHGFGLSVLLVWFMNFRGTVAANRADPLTPEEAS